MILLLNKRYTSVLLEVFKKIYCKQWTLLLGLMHTKGDKI